MASYNNANYKNDFFDLNEYISIQQVKQLQQH